MKLREIRPHFDLRVPLSAAAAMQRVARYLAANKGEVCGWVHESYAELALPERDRHLWCPRLALHADERDGEAGTLLACRLQPEPGIWSMYLALWAVLLIGTMLVIGVGCSQMLRGATPSALWYGLPVAGAVGLGVYASALLGQRLGEDEVEFLTTRLHLALADDSDSDDVDA